ncbi:MAG: tannase/feruloyl esterase family alpha/beta hydrolase [Vicinamibacterales bacterium]
MRARFLLATGLALALPLLSFTSQALLRAAAPAQLAPAEAGTCAALAQMRLSGGAVTAANAVAPGAFVPPTPANAAAAKRFAALPAFCRVQATLTPTTDSDIRIEVWLPASGWNGRFQGVGGRALGGIIVYPAMAEALAAGYATASTDTGHVGAGGAFGLGHPEKVIDHGHRAVHEMTVAAKAIVAGFYARPAQRAYFNGCSLGGRQGLAEAQRYPLDYDGIVAGDIAHNIRDLYASRLAQHQFAHRSAQSSLDAAALRTLNAGAVAACDRADGLEDGVIDRPQQCRFDPGTLTCGVAGAGTKCLTPEQVDTARFIYRPVIRPDERGVVSNGLMPGSEAGWGAILGNEPERNSVEVYRYLVFKDPQWDWRTFSLTTALDATPSSQLREIDATNPDLTAFFRRGGKLLLTHGWADPQTPPLNGVDYYTRTKAAVGNAAADASLRLFMVPGMGHCEGGVGTDTFDAMEPLSQWVERGVAPERFEARRVVDGAVVRTRPLCAYPNVARWNGTGDSNAAANFSCVAP